jgi:hypothetical protein
MCPAGNVSFFREKKKKKKKIKKQNKKKKKKIFLNKGKPSASCSKREVFH